MRLGIWLSVGVATVLAASAPLAEAQVGTSGIEDAVSRPGSRGPSTVIGQSHARAGGRVPVLGGMARDVSLLGARQFQPSGWGRSVSRGSAALQSQRLGLGQLSAPPPGIRIVPESLGRLADTDMLWGLSAAAGMALPVPGMGAERATVIDARAYVGGQKGTAFDTYFGLQPTERAPEPAGRPVVSLADQIEEQTTERVRVAEREGLALFKEASVETRDPRTGRYPNCQDCDDKLVRAVQRLTFVRDLDRQAYLPCVLIAHAALEQECPRTALRSLLQGFQRNPDLFLAAAEALARQFGDGDVTAADHSAYLEAQMRRYVGIGGPNSESVEAWVLEMYCAWRLGDAARARAAAGQVTRLTGQYPERYGDILRFVSAMQAALR